MTFYQVECLSYGYSDGDCQVDMNGGYAVTSGEHESLAETGLGSHMPTLILVSALLIFLGWMLLKLVKTKLTG